MVDDDGQAVDSRIVVRDVVSIAALCELAEETAAAVTSTSSRPNSWRYG